MAFSISSWERVQHLILPPPPQVSFASHLLLGWLQIIFGDTASGEAPPLDVWRLLLNALCFSFVAETAKFESSKQGWLATY